MSAFGDFFQGIADAAVPPDYSTPPSDNQASTATQLGAGFFDILKTVANSGSVKKAVTDTIAQSKTVQQYKAEQTAATIKAYLTNPLVWLGVAVVVLIIGGIGYHFGKR